MENDIRYLLPKQRNKSRGSNIWYGPTVVNGKVKWISLNTEDKKKAMDWFSKMQASRWLPPEQTRPGVKLDDAIRAFLLDVENVRKRTAGTVILYSRYLKQFNNFCQQKNVLDMQGVTPVLCSEFAQISFVDSSAYTIRSKICLLRHFFSWTAEYYNIAGKNPFAKIVAPKLKSEPREFWTVEECEKIIAAALNEETKCWFALMAFAGLRLEEARFLKMDNLNSNEILFVGKGGKLGRVPISSRLKKYMDEYLAIRGDEPGILFPWLSKLYRAPDYLLKYAVEKAKLTSTGVAHCHRFRHSFASNLLRIGRSIKAVQMLMRHENVTLTLNIYGHLLPSDLEQAVEL
ncbi:MAG: tyrosine-type recombinase/integrase [Fibromonadaceae bacterium]|jgi:site-specific recombinase XerD|nr:tyrosine-type recombinase/integrase [Fibromonadaceae bacterium]